MHREMHRTLRSAGLLIAATAAAACGSGSDVGPGRSPLVIAKAATKSGDAQTGPVSQALPSSLRVVVTRDGTPEPDVTVTWSAGAGAVGPGTDQTDANGESTSLWVLGDQAGPQSASASVTGATGSPVTFTATATSGPPPATVQVLGPAGGNRFSPAEITVVAGTTVTWDWGEGAVSHSVVPDNGTTPQSSGPVVDAPHSYSFTFDLPGTYHYHCASHGTAGGGGMSGTVTVTSQF